MSEYASLLPNLSQIASEAGRIAQQAKLDLRRELKPDGSIVTNGDQEVERYLREHLVALVPGSTVWGEEFGHNDEGESGLWLVDPVDGTSNYSYGSPLWGVSIALLKGRHIELGAVALPDLSELYISARGHGVTCNEEPLPMIKPGCVKPEELVSFSDRVLKQYPPSVLPGKMRHAGAVVIDGCFVARQRYRGMIGIREKLYDIGACVLFGQELGADVRYADGSEIDLRVLTVDAKIGKPWIIFPKDSGFFLNGS